MKTLKNIRKNLLVLLCFFYAKVYSQVPPYAQGLVPPCMKTMTLSINTGYNYQDNPPIPAWGNQLDMYWRLTSSDGYGNPIHAIAWNWWQPANWNTNTTSRAISCVNSGQKANNNANAFCNLANGHNEYDFTRFFYVDLDKNVTSINATLNCTIQVDDKLEEVFIDGVPLGLNTNCMQLGGLNTFNATLNLGQGLHKLTFRVRNRDLTGSFPPIGASGTSTMAFKLEGTMSANDTVFVNNRFYRPNTYANGNSWAVYAPYLYPHQPILKGQCLPKGDTIGLVQITNYDTNFIYSINPSTPIIKIDTNYYFYGILGSTYQFHVSDWFGCGVDTSYKIVSNNMKARWVDTSTHCVPVGTYVENYPILPDSNNMGTPPYIYTFNPFPSITNTGGIITHSYTIGVNTFKVVDSVGCEATDTFSIGNRFSITAVATPPCVNPGKINVTYTPNPILSTMQYSLNYGTYVNSPAFNITTQGIYTLVAKDTFGCADTTKIEMHPNPVVSTSTTYATCPATTTALPAGLSTYQWISASPSPFTSFSPTNQAVLNSCWGKFVNKNYTVVATDKYGCIGTATGIYTEDPFCCPACITSCSPAGGIANAQLIGSQWNNPNAHKFSPHPFYNNNTTADLLNAFGNPANNIITTNDIIIFDGSMSINKDITFLNCPNLFFTANANFTLINNSNAIFTIDGCTLRTYCHETFWDGIYVNTINEKVIVQNSNLFDMYNGIVSTNGGKVNIFSNRFVNNYISITLRNAPIGFNFNNGNCQIGANTFTSTNLPCSMGGIGTANNFISANTGIRVVNCKEIEIGHLDFGVSTNTFTKIKIGINIISNISTQNEVYGIFDNIFEDMKYPNVNEIQLFNGSQRCVGILCNIINNTQANHTLNVDYDLVENFGGVHFRNVDNAILGSYVSANVKNVRVRDCLFGFLFNRANGQLYDIGYNNFNDPNIFTAIEIIGSPISSFKRQSKIHHNIINLRPEPIGVPNLQTNAKFPSGIHIICDNTYNGSNGTQIFENNIRFSSSGGIGIAVENAKGSYPISLNTVVNNNTNPNLFTNFQLAAHYALLNCSSPYMFGNNSLGNSSLLIINNFIEGLRIENSKNSKIICNNFTNTRIGTQVNGNCEPSTFETNKFTNHGNAIRFGIGQLNIFGQVVGSLIVGSLGNIGDNNNDLNNTFTNSALFNAPFNFSIYRWGNIFNGGTPKEYFSSNLSQSVSGAVVVPPPFVSDPRYIIKPVLPNATIKTCAINFKPAMKIIKETFTETEALNIINDSSTIANFEVENSDLQEGSLFYAIASGEDTLLNNPVIKQFYDEQLLTKRDELFKVDSLISVLKDSSFSDDSLAIENHLLLIRNANAQVSGGTEAEIDEQLMNIFLERWMHNIPNIDRPEIDTLPLFNADEVKTIETIAMRCPYIYGNAVYKARMLYSSIYIGQIFDNIAICNANGSLQRSTDIVSEATINETLLQNIMKAEISIYPNPATNEITIDYSLLSQQVGRVTIYDVVGKARKRIDLSSQNNRVKCMLNDLEMGIYIYKYEVNNETKQTGKLTIE